MPKRPCPRIRTILAPVCARSREAASSTEAMYAGVPACTTPQTVHNPATPRATFPAESLPSPLLFYWSPGAQEASLQQIYQQITAELQNASKRRRMLEDEIAAMRG